MLDQHTWAFALPTGKVKATVGTRMVDAARDALKQVRDFRQLKFISDTGCTCAWTLDTPS